jgi:L-lactate dehydrogenase complex protein LldG
VGSRQREQILLDIERSLGGMNGEWGQGQADGTAAAPEWVPEDAPWDEVKKELEALSDRFHVAEQARDLHRILEEIIQEHHVSLAVRWNHPLLERLGIDRVLADRGVEVRVPSREEEWKAIAAKAQLGITAVDALVMESGTLILKASKEWGRAVSLVPPVHLAIVRPNQRLGKLQALPRLFRYWAKGPHGLPSAIALITGHSRTADIELILVSGVHGPGMVHVIGLSPGYDSADGAVPGTETRP